VSFCVFFGNERLRQNFFPGLGENTCSLQPALKSNATGFTAKSKLYFRRIKILFSQILRVLRFQKMLAI